MKHWRDVVIGAVLAFVVSGMPSLSVAADMEVKADLREMPRGLLKTEAVYPADPGTIALLYPKWIPGIHGPRNPLRNLAEIYVESRDGKRLEWRRDPEDEFRFLIEVPEDCDRIKVRTTYICNQPTTNSRGVDSYGYPLLGAVNWSTCLLYPEGKHIDEIDVDLSITFPEDWEWGTSLKEEGEKDGNGVDFKPVSFQELVDSPLIAGKHFRTLDITPTDQVPHRIHLVSESSRAIRPKEKVEEGLKRLVAEGMALFREAPFDEYHFLLVLSDRIPRLGLEHLSSSLNSVDEQGLTDEDAIPGTFGLLGHEYCHSWCGKYRRPAGMITPDYHTPKDTRMLWVYEGLDTYLGNVLAARSGMIAKEGSSAFEEALKDLAQDIIWKRAQKGRRSITLQDTASSAHLRRGWSRYWKYLNRPQDYYAEGAMLWMHVDAILRTESDGELSLDDFCRRFLANVEADRSILPFEEEDIITHLNDLVPYDWSKLINERVRSWHQELPLDFLGEVGYRLQFSNKPTDVDDDMVFTSLGMRINDSGSVNYVVPGEAAEKAGVYDGMEVVGVNGRKFSQERLKDAIADSVAEREIRLLTLQGEVFKTVTIPYDDGPRYADLVRIDERPDLLKKIWAPLLPVTKEAAPE